MANVNWWLDFVEILDLDGVETRNVFWVGPFTWEVGSQISVQEFVDTINDVLDARVTSDINDIYGGWTYGATMNKYQITPNLRLAGSWMGVEGGGIGSNDAGGDSNSAAYSNLSANELHDQYLGLTLDVAQSSDAAGTAGESIADFYNSLTNNYLGGDDRFVIRFTIHNDEPGYGPEGYIVRNVIIEANNGIHGAATPALASIDDGGGPGSGDASYAATPFAEVSYVNASSTALTLVPSSAASTIMLDNPPLPPNFRIFPYMGINNRLLLMFNSNTGKYLARPEVLKATDVDAISDLYLHQYGVFVPPDQIIDAIAGHLAAGGGAAYGLKVLYENDDPIEKYELFRLEDRPTSYSDFGAAQAFSKTVDSHVYVNKFSSGASYIDSIVPNKKYYYCARALDVHGNFSNPTHVFQIELVDNEGQTYLILDTIMLQPEVVRSPTKSGRRFLYIEPSLINLSVDQGNLENDYSTATTETLPASNLLGETIPTGLGAGSNITALEGPIWDKTFKVRLTSKKSYKKIDLNITFKNTGVDNP